MIITPASAQPFTLGGPGGPELLYGAVDPDTAGGVPAPECSLYAQTTDGQIWRKVGPLDTDWEVLGAGNPTNGWFGTGEDGAHTVVGTETLVTDVQYTTLRVPNGTTLIVNGGRVFATISITVEAGGTIRNNGTTATTNAGAAGGPGVSMPNGANGGSGQTGVGSNGAAISNQMTGLPANTCRGGSGGAGASAGGNGGTISAASLFGNPPWWGFQAIRARYSMVTGSAGSGLQVGGGGSGGGGGGGSGAGNQGGGGGGGGGTYVLCSPVITNDGAIEARGGNGAPGQSGDSGGGGGGGGGTIYIVGALAGTAPDVSGGTGGAGLGTGNAGANGNAGYVITLQP